MVMAVATVLIIIGVTFLVVVYLSVWPPNGSPQAWRRVTRPLRKRIWPRRYERL
jgi:hypothetical protein